MKTDSHAMKLDAKAVAAGFRPLSEIRPFDQRTVASEGGLPAYLRWLFRTIMAARSQTPFDPYHSEVAEDIMLAGNLDHALKLVLTLAQAWGVDVTEDG